MCHSVLLFWFFCWHWGIPVDRDGLWLLRGHLQTSPLHGHSSQFNVTLVLATYLAGFINAAIHMASPSSCLSATSVSSTTFSVTFHPSWNSLVLTLVSMKLSFLLLPVLMSWAASWPFSLPISASSVLSWGSALLMEALNLLHLRVPPDGGHHLLWHNPVHVSAPQVQILNGPRQSAVCVLYGGHPHVKSSHL